jgi:Carboxypeptidase regulatory-like domain
MSFKIPQFKNHEGDGSTPYPSDPATTGSGVKISLSKLQTFVSLTAGLLSIIGALVAIPNFFKSAPGKGELVAIVRDAKKEKAVADATIEILTPQGTLVTTLMPDSSGKASYALDEGHFRVRVSRPGFSNEVRDVQVVSRRSTEVHVQLRASASPSPSPSFPRSIRRLLGR